MPEGVPVASQAVTRVGVHSLAMAVEHSERSAAADEVPDADSPWARPSSFGWSFGDGPAGAVAAPPAPPAPPVPPAPPSWLPPLPPSGSGPPAPAAPPAPDGGLAWPGIAALLVAAFMVSFGFVALLRTLPARPRLAPTAVQSPDAPAGGAAGPSPFAPLGPNGATGDGTGAPTLSDSAPSSAAVGVLPGVVNINTATRNGAAAGTGMVLTSDGEVLTNNHVVEGASRIAVTVVSTGHTYNATVLGTDPTDDIALIKLSGASGLAVIPRGDSNKAAVGEAVLAIGNAGGTGNPTVSSGVIQALDQTMTASDVDGSNAETLTGLIQISATLQPGESGGPLVTAAGKVIGMNTAAAGGRRFRTRGSIGFAIPLAKALNVAEQIEKGKSSSTIHIGPPAFLGIGFGSDAGSAVIQVVEPGTPAAAIGLTPRSTITAFDGQSVASADALSSAIKRHKPGDRVKISWTDGSGATHSATATLTTGPAD